MKVPDDVSAMPKLKALDWGVKRIAAKLDWSKHTMKRWLGLGGWRPCAPPSRSKRLQF